MQSYELFFKSPSAEEFFKTLRNELLQGQRPASEIFLDDADLCSYLKVSKRHTANLRAKRLLTYSKSGGKIYYRLSDVIAFIEKNEVKAIPSSHNFLTPKTIKNGKNKM